MVKILKFKLGRDSEAEFFKICARACDVALRGIFSNSTEPSGSLCILAMFPLVVRFRQKSCEAILKVRSPLWQLLFDWREEDKEAENTDGTH